MEYNELVMPTEEEIKSFCNDMDNYNKEGVIANNFVVNLKCLIKSFNDLVKIMVNNKKEGEGIYDVSYKIDKGLKMLKLPATVYGKDGLLHIIVVSETNDKDIPGE